MSVTDEAAEASVPGKSAVTMQPTITPKMANTRITPEAIRFSVFSVSISTGTRPCRVSSIAKSMIIETAPT
jgi:hypothetical protein